MQGAPRRGGREPVGEGRADHALDGDEDIALGVPAHSLPGGEIDRHAGGGGGVVDGVGSRAAVEGIEPRTGHEGVVAGPAIQSASCRGGDEPVGEGRSDDALDRDERIARGGGARSRSGDEIDDQAGGGGGVVHRIAPGAAVEGVGPEAGDEGVVARATGEEAARGPGREPVGEGRADHALDGDEGIARGIPAARGAGGKVDRDTSRGGGIVRDVPAAAAVEGVGPEARDEGVVARTADEEAAGGPGREPVGEGRSEDVLDGDEAVALRVPAADDARREIDGDTGRRGGVVGGVAPGATVEGIGPRAAHEGVVARPAGEQVGGRIADEHVRAGRADHGFDPDQPVALGAAARAGPPGEGDADRVGGGGVVDGVAAAAALEDVGPEAGDEGVVARAAGEAAAALPGDETIGESGADGVLDVDEDIPLGGAPGDRPRGEIDADRGQGGGVVGGVRVGPAVEGVGPRPRDEGVVPCPALEQAARRAGGERVGEGRPDHALDGDEGVALGIGAGTEARREVDGDPRGRGCVVGDVRARAAVEGVVPGARGEGVVAGAALQQAAARGGREDIREGGADDVLDRGQEVALGAAAAAAAEGEIDADGRRGGGIVDGVDPGPAVERVRPEPRNQGVVARPAREAAPRRPGGQEVAEGRADEVRDADEDVACGVAPQARTRCEIDGHGGGGGGVVGRVDAAAAFEGVRAGPADQRVGAAIADQVIGVAASLHGLEVGEAVAAGVSAGRLPGREVDRDPRIGRLVGEQVRPGAAVQRVGPRPGDHRVVAEARIDGGPGRVRPEHVDREAGHRIRVGGARLVGHVADGELHGARGGGRGVQAVARDVVVQLETEEPVEPVGVLLRQAVRQGVLQVERGRRRVRRIEGERVDAVDRRHPDEAHPRRQIGDVHALDDPIRVGHRGRDLHRAGGRPDPGIGRVVRVDDIREGGSRDGVRRRLGRVMRVRVGGRHGQGATDLLTSGRERLRRDADDPEQRRRDLRRRDVVLPGSDPGPVADVVGIAGPGMVAGAVVGEIARAGVRVVAGAVVGVIAGAVMGMIRGAVARAGLVPVGRRGRGRRVVAGMGVLDDLLRRGTGRGVAGRRGFRRRQRRSGRRVVVAGVGVGGLNVVVGLGLGRLGLHLHDRRRGGLGRRRLLSRLLLGQGLGRLLRAHVRDDRNVRRHEVAHQREQRLGIEGHAVDGERGRALVEKAQTELEQHQGRAIGEGDDEIDVPHLDLRPFEGEGQRDALPFDGRDDVGLPALGPTDAQHAGAVRGAQALLRGLRRRALPAAVGGFSCHVASGLRKHAPPHGRGGRTRSSHGVRFRELKNILKVFPPKDRLEAQTVTVFGCIHESGFQTEGSELHQNVVSSSSAEEVRQRGAHAQAARRDFVHHPVDGEATLDEQDFPADHAGKPLVHPARATAEPPEGPGEARHRGDHRVSLRRAFVSRASAAGTAAEPGGTDRVSA